MSSKTSTAYRFLTFQENPKQNMTSKALRAKSNLSQGWVNSVVLCGSPQMQAFRLKEQ